MIKIDYDFNILLNPLSFFKKKGVTIPFLMFLKRDLGPEYKEFISALRDKIETNKSPQEATSSLIFCKNVISVDDFIEVGSYIKRNPKSFDKDVQLILDLGSKLTKNPDFFRNLNYLQIENSAKQDQDPELKKLGFFKSVYNFLIRILLLKNYVLVERNILDLLHLLLDILFQSETTKSIRSNGLFLIRYLWQLLRLTRLEEETKQIILGKIRGAPNISTGNFYCYVQKIPIDEVPNKFARQPYHLLHHLLYTLENEANELGCFDFYQFFMDIILTYIKQTYHQKALARILNQNTEIFPSLEYNNKNLEQIFRPLRQETVEFSSLLSIVYEQAFSYQKNENKRRLGEDFYRKTLNRIDTDLKLKSLKIKDFPVFKQYTGSCFLSSMFKIFSYWTKHKPIVIKDLEPSGVLVDDLKKEKELENFINSLHAPFDVKQELLKAWRQGKGGYVHDWLLQPVIMPTITPDALYEALRTYGPLWCGGWLDETQRQKFDPSGPGHAVCVIRIIHNWFIVISDSNDNTYIEHILPFDAFLKRVRAYQYRYKTKGDLYGGPDLIQDGVPKVLVNHAFWYYPQALQQYTHDRA